MQQLAIFYSATSFAPQQAHPFLRISAIKKLAKVLYITETAPKYSISSAALCLGVKDSIRCLP